MLNRVTKTRLIVLVLLFLLPLNCTFAQERVFKGSVSITSGRFEDYFLRAVTASQTIYAKPGETVHFKIYLRRGEDEATLHDVHVIDNNEDFVMNTQPEIIEEIRNIDMIPLKTSLYVPEDIPPGRYPLLIKVKAKEFVEESYPIDTVVKVGEHTNIFDFIFLFITSVLVTIMVYRIINIKKLGK